MIKLAKRQREILELFAEGLSAKEIAQELDIKVTTVKSVNRVIFEKLGATNITHAVAIAIKTGQLSIGTNSGFLSRLKELISEEERRGNVL